MDSKEYRLLKEQIEELQTHLALLQRRNPITEEVFLDTDQMERLLKCSPSTLYRLRKNSQIPYIKIGKKFYYPKNYFTGEVIKNITAIDPSKKFDE